MAKENKDSILKDIRKIWNDAVKTHGYDTARWAFRKVISDNSKRDRLLKRKEQIENELQDIETKL